MKKIIDILKKSNKEERIFLDVLVSTKDNKLVLLNDSLVKGFDKDCETFRFELIKPTFEVLALSCTSLHNEGGQYDPVAGGKVIFDACYMGNQGELTEIQGFAELYVGLCAKCSGEAELAYVDYKKK